MESPAVLVVDDDPDTCAMLGYALGGEFTLRFARSSQDGIDELATNPPDAMILDVAMGGVDGFELLEERRARGLAPHTHVLILSARTDERDLVRGWSLGAHDYLFKPTDPDHIAAKLRAHLAATVGR